MTATFLATELSNLISEAKRKHSELRNAAEKSLQELKALTATSEQQLAADLSRRSTFVDPFLIACNTRNPKIAAGGVACLQRLVVSKGLPKTRLKDALNAFNACTEVGLDVQLKVLQALPSLVLNYTDDLKGDLLAASLQVCTSLQSVKARTVSGVAAATLQQLVTTVFEKVADEDRRSSQVASVAEVPGSSGSLALRPAAYDAYRIFRDLVLAAEERQTRFVQPTALPPESSLELIWSCLHGNARLIMSHPELLSIVQSNLLPLVTRALSEKVGFPLAVRSMRILNLLLVRYLSRFPDECEVALGLLTHSLEADNSTPWKRALSMEVIRDFFANGSLVIEAYTMYDGADSGKPIVQDIMSAFVRLSTENPAAIGLGQQSSIPEGPASTRDLREGPSTVDASGAMAAVFSSALGVADLNLPGISTQWSLPRSACLNQLDKSEAPALPDTYVYAMVLECLSSLSDALARVVLPLSVQQGQAELPHPSQHNHNGARLAAHITRSPSFRKRAVPVNPLDLRESPSYERVLAVAGIIDNCWPAVLATSSTFLNASLEDQFYRNLIKAYQRFAQTAGLLRLRTPRDALMTTLSKSAVPPHVLKLAMNDGVKTSTPESPRMFTNAKATLSVDSIVSQASTTSTDWDRRFSTEPQKPVLTTRNLLCLRALLNLAIALGPTLDTAFSVVVDALRQADVILSSGAARQLSRPGSSKGLESPLAVQAFSAEVAAVEAAASRLLESTADYPNDAFEAVVEAFARFLGGSSSGVAAAPKVKHTSSPSTPASNEPTDSDRHGMSIFAHTQAREHQFVIPKLGTLAELNVARSLSNELEERGWTTLVNLLARIAITAAPPHEVRRAATDILCKVVNSMVTAVIGKNDEIKAIVERRAFAVLLRLVEDIYSGDGNLTNTDLEIQSHVLEALTVILERCGESLLAGWDKIISVVSYAFERSGDAAVEPQPDGETPTEWHTVTHDFVSVQVGRIAFAATQLICSDFLPAVPTGVIPAVIELLHHFIMQPDDLNIALTAVTMAWNLSDYLLGTAAGKDLDALVGHVDTFNELEHQSSQVIQESESAQLVLLLLRLRSTVCNTKKEIRNATFQTICNIFNNHGDQLGPSTWNLLLRSIVIRIASDDLRTYSAQGDSESEEHEGSARADESMSRTIIAGVADIFAQHLQSIEQIRELPHLWDVLINTLEGYLDCESHLLNAAVYTALATVLSHVDGNPIAWAKPLDRTVALWQKRPPVQDETTKRSDGNQDAYTAYIETAAQLYRLCGRTMRTSQVCKLINNIYHCVSHSDGPRYGADVERLSPLQDKSLGVLKAMRLDSPELVSRAITMAAQLSLLHHDGAKEQAVQHGPTFVALASESIAWTRELVVTHINNVEVVNSGALLSAIESLQRVAVAKYEYQAEHKGVTLWRRATTAALALAEPVLSLTDRENRDQEIGASLWTTFTAIASGIAEARGLANAEDGKRVYDDQMIDIGSFQTLRDVLIPRLGRSNLPDDVRHMYCRSLFHASLVHPVEDGEVPDPTTSPLENLQNIRRGRARHIPYSQRERMSYVCFSELITLASRSDDTPERKKLAQAAAPLLILRLAVPIRAYIADQPLRGASPQPLSELEELLFSFTQIGKLQLHPEALVADAVADGRRGSNAHLHFLYPLLIRAVAEAGDSWSGAEEVLRPLQAVLAAISPVP